MLCSKQWMVCNLRTRNIFYLFIQQKKRTMSIPITPINSTCSNSLSQAVIIRSPEDGDIVSRKHAPNLQLNQPICDDCSLLFYSSDSLPFNMNLPTTVTSLVTSPEKFEIAWEKAVSLVSDEYENLFIAVKVVNLNTGFASPLSNILLLYVH